MWNIDRRDGDHVAEWEAVSPTGLGDRIERLSMLARQATSDGSTVDAEG
jgi:hypothetical protein